MTNSDPTAAPAGVPANLANTHRPADRYGFVQASGARLRFACWNGPAGGRGTVVVLPGRGEFIEKYATEAVGKLLDRGFAVHALDWRGQGLSDRPLPDHDKGHVDNFITFMADLKQFLDTVVAPAAPRPILAVAHSMGGHVLLRHLAERGAGPLAAALTVSPMTGLHRQWLLQAVLTLAPELPRVDHCYLPGGGPFARESRDFAKNIVTHDERRFHFTDDWFRADPRLTLGGPTFGWGRQALRSMAASLAPGMLERIDLPVLLVSASGDRLVDIASHGPVIARIRHGRHVTIEGAAHEIMMETDPLLAQFWQAFDRLADEIAG